MGWGGGEGGGDNKVTNVSQCREVAKIWKCPEVVLAPTEESGHYLH